MTTPLSQLSRRLFLAGLMAGPAASALGAPLDRSPVPRPRPELRGRVADAAQLIEAAGLSGKFAFALVDVETGTLLEAHKPLLGLPPASVAKSVTALYALDALGPEFRFSTRLIATGPVTGGRLEGDLVLAGGGDPTLDTDLLGDLAAQLKAAGVTEVRGRFLYHAGALPGLPAIDPGQPPQVGYNPAISGLNLNFNRVHFEWRRAAGGYAVTMDARARRYAPQVGVARIHVVDRATPVYTYASNGGIDEWTVAQGALGAEGARWLPVRRPALYCAEVFQTLARSHGIVLDTPQEVAGAPAGIQLGRIDSAPLAEILRGMLKYSTNVTAEAVGLASTIARGARPQSLAESGQAMTEWLQTRMGAHKARFVDHSGLGDASRLSPMELVRTLAIAAPEGRLRPLLKDIPIRDDAGRPQTGHPVEVSAKTGTLNFVSALAGYIGAPGGRQMAFAMFSADEARRARLGPEEMEHPPGGKAWISRSRALQQDFLRRWADLYA
ncbi:D-alanyl-D-alanine carboxypeptidase/D-alanyl-D-alanine-endopeptidase [Rhodovulum sulfidophilum]|uniref:D-alanyl-D-alanine carboxypeptidase/D-alanyl-D-alanine-endopeptidase n=1 Tax=Rhodovulum visakhapatnamense TaxID=364297 RepID=A0ABS1RJ74_9RHOB|nr:D-alanyl-D-alanine carboxypeptidase/D-alanyl-D-alanine-endopeptidase [Rhodovulum visakhapatnamense]MBL3571129.1 D-alanyl-D-alanine carboxypeptidase/D-alanyl-D-alanine-endopeptidase [Rhodovulum visakhapatnamense]MBL3579714.1 D-alanyl-D-alanine carboxypeptidase/D-alanyl-D-alanine-endopeptidase [Rhodovulum visakhapatnamense]OLS44120.1 D-alanyl-D-alanine carboxypeptidase/D-alanyl-D-alanine-endopeptidase [Rhodovulum sulfidophilum]